jgi:hypothetical protein
MMQRVIGVTRRVPLRHVLALTGACCLAACELVVGGIPKQPHRSGSNVDASALPSDAAAGLDAAGMDASLSHEYEAGSGAHPDAASPDAASGDAGHQGDASAALDAGHLPDAGVAVDAGHDSGTPPERDSGSPADAGHDETDACVPRRWYQDYDKDTYGDPTRTQLSCAKPSGPTEWVTRAGDCADDVALAHPGQTKDIANPYKVAGGGTSYDFDCSGKEEPKAGQALAPADCGVPLTTACNKRGSGFAKVTPARTGATVNPYCGSKTISSCVSKSLILCVAENSPATTTFFCH